MIKSSLSEDQRRRMEENKRQALAKRQQRLHAQSSIQPNAPPRSSTNESAPAVANVARSSSENAQQQQQSCGGVASKTVTLNNAFHNHSLGEQHRKSYNQANFSNNKKFGNQRKTGFGSKEFYGAAAQPLKGQCVLISKDRFEVNIGFNQTVIEVFKTCSSKMYDAGKRKWSFNLRDHEALMKAVNDLRPAIQVDPLPRAILQVFRGKSAGESGVGHNYIPQADLSQVDAKLVDSLMPFQREGVNFGVHLKGRVLIADDMGLGKTLQAICLACVYRAKWPLLIVTPSSVRFDWAQQLRRWVPSLDPELIRVSVSGRDNAASGLVNIISYDLVSRKLKELTAARFQVIIMDESHFLKNHKTVRTKAALPLLQSAQHVILLSGTPALSRPVELYTQIVAVCPRLFKFHDFGLRYCEGKELPWGWDYSGSSNMQELQLLLEEKVMIRRMKSEVLSQLPAKRRQMVILDPVSVSSSKSLVQASKVMEKKLSGMQRRGALLQYFHETCKVKVNAVRDYVLDMIAAEKKFLIFAHHQEMLDSIEQTVTAENVQYIRIDGRTTSEQRNFFCRKFQSHDECKVAVLSITAANAGLNLAAASIVVFAELFWNPGILIQAEDRAHRLGQQDSVLVYYLVAQKTADDYVWPLIQNKLEVLNRAGLAGQNFDNTDTAHIRDPKQKRLLDMFEESFLEETSPEDESLASALTASPPKLLQSSPPKRNPPHTPSKKRLTPSKGQTGIGQFFKVDGLQTAKSPPKHKPSDAVNQSREKTPPGFTSCVNCSKDSPRLMSGLAICEKCISVNSDPSLGAKDDLGPENDAMSSDWDDAISEEAMAMLAEEVDWDDDDFDFEPHSKKMKT